MNVQQIYHADVFFDAENQGNQAAVFLLDEALEPAVMQTMASEQGLPASAFIWPELSELYAIRWFSSTQAISLCGHATLAAAKLLYENEKKEFIEFVTQDSILLSCRLTSEQASIILPVIKTEEVKLEIDFINALNTNIQKQYQTADEQGYVILEVKSFKAVRELKPDFNTLSQITQRAIIVTALDTEQIGFRYFAPQYGNNEDQATGSALCVLADFYEQEYSMQNLDAVQLSEHGGKMQSKLLDISVEVFGKVRIKNK